MVAVLTVVAAAPQRAHAHEMGTTRVTVHFPTPDTYQIEIVTDGDALTEKLQSVTGRAIVDQQFLNRAVLKIDDRVMQPEVWTVVTPAGDDLSPAIATVSLNGSVPADARRLTWSYGWTFASYAFSVERRGGASTQWLDGDQTSAPVILDEVLPSVNGFDIAVQYLVLGFTHIVPRGIDHILFVLGLFLLSTSWRSLMWQVTAFTVAHTITLALAVNGLVSGRPSIVEPLIAASIAYVAVENVLLGELKPWRIALVFAFGLLHGLGFAGVLGELGLPRDQFATALIAFNLGVEGGQSFVIAAAILAVGWWRSAPSYRRRVVVPASLAIACVSMYWTVLRLL